MAPAPEPSRPDPFKVVIVGGGTAGWMAASALVKLLPAQDYAITLIESEEIGTVGVGEATLPHIKVFNDTLGIDEAQFMRDTQAVFKAGIEFVDWDVPGERYVHPFGTFGEPWAGVDFQHHWARARAADKAAELHDYSYAIAVCRNAAFEHPNEDPKSIRSTYSYAYHFDAGLYARFLRRWAEPRGVTRIEGKVVDIVRDPASGHVAALRLEAASEVAGDLFIDCSGFRSLLVGGAMGVAWHDWSDWLPCDRAFAIPSIRTEPLLPFTRLTAREAGWTWRIGLQHRTGNGYVFSSRFTDEERARDVLLGALDAPPLGEPRLLRFQAGRRAAAWAGNCVAIGLASGFLEPLESTSIFLIQAGVMDLIGLMPTLRTGIDPRLAAEYNRLFEVHYDRIRDFLVLHYTANRRHGQPLWDHVRCMELPDTLAHKIALFEASAAAPDYRYGLFSRDSWLAVLVGQGILPRSWNPLAEAIPIDELEARLADLKYRIEANAADMTPHGDFVRSYCLAPALEPAA